MFRGILIALAIFVGASAHAAPPKDSPGTFGDWFKHLNVPGGGTMTCCDVSDCRFVESRYNPQRSALLERRSKYHRRFHRLESTFESIRQHQGIYEAHVVRDEYVKALSVNIKWDTPNPTGHSVLCWTPYNDGHPDPDHGVYCFIPISYSFNEYVDRIKYVG